MDFPCIPLGGNKNAALQLPAGKVYLSPMIDCVDGMVVSGSIRTRPDAELINTMLDAAITKLNDSEVQPVVHSDRGAHGGFNRSSPHWVVEQILGTRSRLQLASSNPAFCAVYCSMSGPRPESPAHSSETDLCL